MIEQPLVSAIITTYGRKAEIVEKALLSVLNQSYSNIEVLVIDDNSNDSNFSDEIQQMCNKSNKCRYIKQNGNKGACAARNLGIVNCRGVFIGFLDDDDIWLPKKIEEQIHYFDADDVGLVFCNGIINLHDSEKEYNNNIKKEVHFNQLLNGDCIGSTSGPLIRKECFKNCGLFWEKQPARQDYEMWLRITKQYKAIGINKKLFIHLLHNDDQISRDKTKAYIGYKNIYFRYKKDYKGNLVAQEYILKQIIKNRKKISQCGFVLKYLIIKCFIKLKNDSC